MIAGLDQFREITGYDIAAFFRRYQTFVQSNYQDIVNYYNGSDLIARSFDALDALNGEISIIEPLFMLHRERFQTIDFWEIIDQFSDVLVAVSTVNNLSKWTRSSRTTQYDSAVVVERTLRQGETFESVSRDLGDSDPINNWSRLTISSYIIEEDYTYNGGVMFNVVFNNNANFNLPNIVDSLQGDNIYGKDIHRAMRFLNNDLETVEFRDALRQTLETILQTRMGSIPEFPSDGIAEDIIGTNVNAIQYPSIFRNLLGLFGKDGRFVEVNLLDLFRENESVIMRIEVRAILKDAFVTNMAI